MLVSEQARVFQVRGLRCSKEPTVLGLSPVRLGNRTYRAWRTTKLTPMVRFLNRTIGVNLGVFDNVLATVDINRFPPLQGLGFCSKTLL